LNFFDIILLMLRRRKAFTLIELLVVIAIVAILSGFIFVYMGSAVNTAKDAKREADVATIAKAIMAYSASSGTYPIDTSCDIVATGGCSTLPANIQNYLITLPRDPNGVAYYRYASPDNGATCTVTATLSNGNIYTYTCGGGFSSGPPWICGSALVDSRNSKSYNTVLIGTQCWMKENLDYNNGCTLITWVNSTDVGWCGYYIGGPFANEGLLYQWSAAMSTTSGNPGICPTGWHVPTHDDWTTLERAINNSTAFPYDTTTTGWLGTNEGTKLKANSALWSPNTGTDTVGFSVLPPGRRLTDGSFGNRSAYTNLWSSSSYSSTSAWRRYLDSSLVAIYRDTPSKAFGFSVRCLKN
jgi:uncharacterized protein (TIGR02145 family)/prepilin-type N-terminal cleavage/methylation domain-containing protein